MDAFYASVEQRDFPEYRNKPLVVGGSGSRGVIAAASYEARKYGVRSAMPSSRAKQLCGTLIFAKPRFDVYHQVSKQIREVFQEYTDLIEPLALDEAYLDVTVNKKGMEYAMDMAREIKEKILERTELVASAGISYNKFLAKIASDFNKPDGFFVITPSMGQAFIEQLPIEKFFGVGKVTAKKMKERGIHTGLDLKGKTRVQLNRWFGKAGNYYYNISRGEDHRAVNPHRERKSLGAERTYSVDLITKEAINEKLEVIIDVLTTRLEKSEAQGKTLTLKVKYADFTQITRSKTELQVIQVTDIPRLSYELVESIEDIDKGVRLLGLTISNFNQENEDQFLGQLEIKF